MSYRSPVTGQMLIADTRHSLAAPHERWPVIDGIAYLRAGSKDRAAEALSALDNGQSDAALMLLLTEQDPWWDGPLPNAAALTNLIANRDRLNLREAMELLSYGRVGDYFAHRWSDPTFVAGLALTDACWPNPRNAFELACGIGHYLRELMRVGVMVTGADIVFSKLWIARHWVVGPQASLVCMDAALPFAVTGSFDLTYCHDAFYFFEDKAHVAAELKRVAPQLLMAHIHNRDAANFSSAAAIGRDELSDFFPGSAIFGDEELTRASVEGRAPVELSGDTEAFAIAYPWVAPMSAFGALSRPSTNTMLRRNPLLGESGIRWPSDRYRDEYESRATYRFNADVPAKAIMDDDWLPHLTRRELLDLPERW